jgi:hypothetical protein
VGVAWEAPPDHRDKVRWPEVAAELRAHPMEWLKVFENGRTTAKEAVSQGHVPSVHPMLGFETKTTDNTRGTPRTCTLFMRYNPDLADPVAEATWQARQKEE